jgi:transcriptional regulator with XRE-family HTH domain
VPKWLLTCNTVKMPAPIKPPGVVGDHVRANLRRLRRGISTYELARRLEAAGWKINPDGITRIETGDRRVTVDDLVALAVVLGVSPNALLLPPVPPVRAPEADVPAVPLVGNVEADPRTAWRWARGEQPLDGSEENLAAFWKENQQDVYVTVSGTADAVTDIVASGALTLAKMAAGGGGRVGPRGTQAGGIAVPHPDEDASGAH